MHSDCRSRFNAGILRAQQVHQFIVDDFDDLLAGLDALDDFRADGLGFDALDEIAGDLEIHVGFQQRHADFTQGFGDVGLGNFSEPAQVAEGVLELAAERIEHHIKLTSAGELTSARRHGLLGGPRTDRAAARPCLYGR